MALATRRPPKGRVKPRPKAPAKPATPRPLPAGASKFQAPTVSPEQLGAEALPGATYVPDADQLRGGTPVRAAVSDVLGNGPMFAPELNSAGTGNAATNNAFRPAPKAPGTPTAATVEQPGSGTFFRRAGQAAADGAKATGEFIKDNPLAITNAALGVTGLIMNATAKSPKLPEFRDFTPNVGPARGMDPGLKSRLQERIGSTRRTSVQEGADNNLNTAARLTAGAVAQNASMDLELKDAEMLRGDEQRLEGIRLNADQANWSGRNQRDMQRFDLNNRRVESQRAQGTAMAQGALDYFTQADAGRRTQEQAAVTQGNETQRARFSQLQTISTNPYATPEMRAQANAEMQQMLAASRQPATREHGGPVPVFKRGGSVSVTVESGGRKSEGASVADKMVAEFSRNINRQAVETTRNFAATLREIYRTKTRPVNSGR